MGQTRKNKIIFYGDIAIDVMIETDLLPQVIPDTSVRDVNIRPGGSSANSAVVASHLNLDAYYMGLIGDDIFRDLLIKDLKDNHVKLDLLRQVHGKNTFVFAVVNKKGESKFFSYRGVNGLQDYGEIADDISKPFDCIHISGYCLQDQPSRETAVRLIRDAQEQQTLVTLDPSFHFSTSDHVKDQAFLSQFDIIMPNLEEACFMTGEKDVATAARIIRQMGAKIMVIKMGADGCFLSYQQNDLFIHAYPVDNVINTIGAGDAFCAGFLCGYLNGLQPEQAARIGNAAAHITLSGAGGHEHAPTLDEVLQLIADKDNIDLSNAFETDRS